MYKKGTVSKNKLNFHFKKKLEREEQMKLRVKWNNKILKIRRILIKYKTKKITKTTSVSFERSIRLIYKLKYTISPFVVGILLLEDTDMGVGIHPWYAHRI